MNICEHHKSVFIEGARAEACPPCFDETQHNSRSYGLLFAAVPGYGKILIVKIACIKQAVKLHFAIMQQQIAAGVLV
nr:hypothetical protein [Mucilaginibacter sp. SP1R1]